MTRHRMLARTGLAAVAALGLSSATAVADSAVISNLDAAGRDDPVAGVGRTFTVVATSTAPRNLYVKYRPSGGAACAPSANSDSGDEVAFYPSGINGTQTFQKVITWSTPGPRMFCVWIAASGSTPVTPITQTVTFRAPSTAINATQAPVQALVNQDFTLAVNLTTEAPAYFYASLANPGAACGATPRDDTNTALRWGTEVNGSYAVNLTAKRAVAGTHSLCTWVTRSSSDPAPYARQSFPVSVVAPPPPPAPVVRSTAVGVTFPRTIRFRAITPIAARVTAAGATPRGRCLVQRYLARRWMTIASGGVASNGICRMTIRMGRRGSEQLRVSYRPSGAFRASVSRYRTVRVR